MIILISEIDYLRLRIINSIVQCKRNKSSDYQSDVCIISSLN